MKKSLYEYIKNISELSTTQEKVNALKTSQYTGALKIVFAYMLNKDIKWLLPEGIPPYKPCEYVDLEGQLLPELRKLYLFVEGGNNNLHQYRRESIFIQLLESIDPNDALLLLAIKDKKLPFKGLNKKIIQQAYPDLNIN